MVHGEDQAEDAISFARTWRRFRTAPSLLLPTPGERERWHAGRRWYHVTALVLDDPRVRARRDEVREALGEWTIPFCDDTPHVTLWVHGFDRTAPPSPPREAAIRIGGANAFRSCTFLEVRSTELPALRGIFRGREERWTHYVPHLTCARFVRALSPAVAAARLRPFRRLPEIHAVGSVHDLVLDAWDDRGRLVPASAVTLRQLADGWVADSAPP